jgi:mevalonate kinase
MFPNMMNGRIAALIDEYRDCALGWKLSGAGGGGYLILVAEEPIPGAIRVIARRETT